MGITAQRGLFETIFHVYRVLLHAVFYKRCVTVIVYVCAVLSFVRTQINKKIERTSLSTLVILQCRLYSTS